MKKRILSVLLTISMVIGIISTNAVSISFEELSENQEINESNIYFEEIETNFEETNSETEVLNIEDTNINFEEIENSPEATNSKTIENQNINTENLKPAFFINKYESNVQVSVTNKPVVDIMLASKQTNVDLTTFEDDILNALINLGVNTDEFNFVTVDREMISTNNYDGKAIFSTWKKFGMGGIWSVSSDGKTIINAENTVGLTGWYYPNNFNISNMTLEYDFAPYDTDNDFVGVILRFNMDKDMTSTSTPLATQVSGYWYWENSGNGESQSGWNWSKNTGLYRAKSVKLPGNYKSGEYENAYSLGGLPTIDSDAWSIQSGLTRLVQHSTNQKWTSRSWTHYKFQIEGNTFTVWRDGVQIAKYTDDNNLSIKTGSVALINLSQASKYQNFKFSYEYYKTYEQVLREPEWRQEAHHIVVNVDDKEDNSLTGSDTEGEILSRTMNDKIHFIQWGTNTNKTDTTEFINRNDGKGTFIDNSDYNNCVNQTALYIKNLINQTKESQYVIVGQKTNIDVLPAELKQNAVSEDYPNGRWFIHHDYQYFDNNTGLSTQSEFYTPNLLCEFDKPGKYEIYFDDQLVKEIYAHRRPVAEFSLNVSGTNVTMNSESYDLDSNENIGYGNGIASENWYYKEPSETTWHSGKLNSIDLTKTYIVKLEVTDKQGESDYITKYVGSGIPVAAFNYGSDTISKYNPLNVRNTSYDPRGLSITNQEWVLKKDGTTIGTYSSPLTDFSSLGIGSYTYTLTVTNSDGIKSESYTKAFNVVDDNTAPSVIINPTSCEWKTGSQDVSVLFSDGESGFSKWRYAITNSQNKPTSGWSEYKTTSTDNISITNTGIQYLHIEALDNSGNMLSRTVGTYKIDNVKPIINSIPVTVGNNSATVKANAIDSDSGIDSYTLTGSSFNKTQKTDTFIVNLPGVYTLTVTDKVGNSISRDVEVNVYYPIHIAWNDNTIPDNLKPTKVILQAKIGDAVVKEVELPYRTENYTFKDLPINDGYVFDLIVSDRYEIVVNNQNITATYQESNFSVIIPKKITLNGNTGKASYTVSVKGTFYYNDTLTVKPNSSFILTDRSNISRMTGTVIQNKTGFTKSDNVQTGTSTKGNISINRTLFSGLWKGSFNFNIKFVRSN